MSSPLTSVTPAPQYQRIDISTISRFFRGVSIANYFMLVGCGNIVLSTLVGVWSMHSAGEFIVAAITIGVCAFATWVGWRNIGVLGAVVHNYTTAALVLLFTFSSLLFVALVPQLFASTEASYSTVAGAVTSLFLALASVAGLLALSVLHRLSLPGLHVRLRDFLIGSAPELSEHRQRLKPVNSIKGYGCLALGLLWLVGMDLIPDDSLPKGMAQQEWRLGLVAYVFLIYARQYLRPDFQTVVASDPRPPVVFLRSFEDDEKLDYQRADSALFDFSLESRLADQYGSLGPFLAVGKPGDKMPHLGAARASLSDTEWQGTVRDWMERSSLIILMIGRTHWIDWELRRVIELGYTGKLMILFPQVRPPRWKFSWRTGRMQDAEDRLTVIRKGFEGTPWESGLYWPDVFEPSNLRSLAFLPGGEVVVVTSRPRNRESYHLAALIARHAQLRAQSRGAAAPVAIPPVRKRKSRWVVALLGTAAVGVAVWSLIATQGAGLFRDPPPKPLPKDFVVKSTGAMQAGNLQYVTPATSEERSGVYHPGDQVSLVYEVTGMGIDPAGKADVKSNTTLLNSDGDPASDTSGTRFHEQMRVTGRIRFTFKMDLSPTAKPGDYRIDVKLHDAVSGADFEFRPLMQVQGAAQ
jgi:hypothetical protein